MNLSFKKIIHISFLECDDRNRALLIIFPLKLSYIFFILSDKHPSMSNLLSEQENSSIISNNGGFRRHRGSLTDDQLIRGPGTGGDTGIWINNNDDSIKYVDERK